MGAVRFGFFERADLAAPVSLYCNRKTIRKYNMTHREEFAKMVFNQERAELYGVLGRFVSMDPSWTIEELKLVANLRHHHGFFMGLSSLQSSQGIIEVTVTDSWRVYSGARAWRALFCLSVT